MKHELTTTPPPPGLPAQTRPPESNPGSWDNTGPPAPTPIPGYAEGRRVEGAGKHPHFHLRKPTTSVPCCDSSPPEISESGAGAGNKCAACGLPPATSNCPPTATTTPRSPESGPRPQRSEGAFSSAQQCGSATTRAPGALRGRREQALPPLRQVRAGGRPLRSSGAPIRRHLRSTGGKGEGGCCPPTSPVLPSSPGQGGGMVEDTG